VSIAKAIVWRIADSIPAQGLCLALGATEESGFCKMRLTDISVIATGSRHGQLRDSQLSGGRGNAERHRFS
jgi:hypothetical protein